MGKKRRDRRDALVGQMADLDAELAKYAQAWEPMLDAQQRIAAAQERYAANHEAAVLANNAQAMRLNALTLAVQSHDPRSDSDSDLIARARAILAFLREGDA